MTQEIKALHYIIMNLNCWRGWYLNKSWKSCSC